MRFALYVSLLLAVVPIVLLRPFFGLCVYYVVSLMQPKVLCWRPEFQDALIIGVPMVCGAVALGVRRFVIEPRYRPGTNVVIGADRRLVRNALFEPSWLLAVMAALVVYIGATRYLAPFGPENSAASYSRLLKMALVTFLLTGLASDLKRFRVLYVVVALSVGFWAIKGGLNVVLLGPHQVYGRNYDNNLFALMSVMVLPMVFYFGISVTHSRWRLVYLTFAALMCLAIIGSNSRAGFVALAAVLFCFAWTSKHRFKALFGVVLLGIVALMTTGHEIQSRIDSILQYRKDDSARSRIALWSTSWLLLSQHPLIGVGLDNFERASAAAAFGRKAAHNIWLSSLVELGVVGFALWLTMILGAIASMYQLMHYARRGPPRTRWCYYWARGLLLGMIAYCIHGLFHNEVYLDLWFAMFGMAVALRATLRRELSNMRLTATVAAQFASAAAQPLADDPRGRQLIPIGLLRRLGDVPRPLRARG